jgi:NhaP-type Na+/H+ and K+/H+ antiporter
LVEGENVGGEGELAVVVIEVVVGNDDCNAEGCPKR